MIRNIVGEGNIFAFGVIHPLIRLSSEILIFVSICILLLVYEPFSSLLTIIFFSLIGYFLLMRTNSKLKIWGKKRQFLSAELLKQLKQGFGSIKEVIINNMENVFLQKFHRNNLEFADVGVKKDTTTQMPRLILELIGIVTFVSLILFLLKRGDNISEIFIIVGVFFMLQ